MSSENYANMLNDDEENSMNKKTSLHRPSTHYSGRVESMDTACAGVEPTIFISLSVLGVFCFISFILGCVATATANDNSSRLDKLENKVGARGPGSDCSQGDILFGATVFESTNAGSRNWYAILGTKDAEIKWNEALHNAQSMCYHGHRGFLANIGSASENVFIQGLIQSMPDYTEGMDAWIGGMGGTSTTGEYVWIGPGKLVEGVPFYTTGGTELAYANWADGEPNSGGASGVSEGNVSSSRTPDH